MQVVPTLTGRASSALILSKVLIAAGAKGQALMRQADCIPPKSCTSQEREVPYSPPPASFGEELLLSDSRGCRRNGKQICKTGGVDGTTSFVFQHIIPLLLRNSHYKALPILGNDLLAVSYDRRAKRQRYRKAPHEPARTN